MDYKSKTKECYDKYAEKFDPYFGEHFELVKPEADLFLKNLKGLKIVDLGSGPGNHAAYFKEKGCDVLCVDLSEVMVKICARKGLKARVMDIENLQLPEDSFDGVWAYASLLHVPKKKIPQVVESVASILKSGGILGLALKEGESEGFIANEKYPGTERWFAHFTDEEVRKLFSNKFELIHSSSANVKNKYVFLNYLFKKRA